MGDRGDGYMDNGAIVYRGYGVQEVWDTYEGGTWGKSVQGVWGTWTMRHMGNRVQGHGTHGKWGTGV